MDCPELQVVAVPAAVAASIVENPELSAVRNIAEEAAAVWEQ